ncbi:methionyl-tRNA formyltransferase [Ehrlichia canis]|uniref:Methionyl-tRNA formyltransferase n=1 Tax=Ehrlichia canis (strain Jake) TaxID=269484 RepID=FMT_EHRCJ|nr:methionyl-tRNA formyltransferase [Ehrlichia canis]Q3YSQ0.1 RecName: Full=Methionyl-tRNA formyltransferase [Ehrlichia canis str. Jake]AAZ68255.1 methionyl-tRNA formyltransferase [Ehrlichia canis str. Jake]AUO54982.1 methionyl-tRNA formyltransferase [Ehrlichia canis]UKC53338.1 methionyl-tRNA formyltransferase [Ehrlichia canis]UKC54274.1 methionyl-tRNA formyltransferase [Ehrlichia canis]UKC55210.1 methionyl-tRNA formyltransferase [Ehrlichia canis]
MKIIFMGSPEFSVSALSYLLENESHEVVAVYTKIPKPAGRRGRILTKTPVHIIAEQNNIEVNTPKSLKHDAEQEKILSLNPDVIVVVAYGLIIPQGVLSIPKYGCINIHPSLLPRWRGAAPIHYAILSGDDKTGVTIIQMNELLDEGDILLQRDIPIDEQDNIDTLSKKLAHLGSSMLIEVLDNIDNLVPIKQNNDDATYAHKIIDFHIDFNEAADVICRKVRALYPRAFLLFNGKRLRILKTSYYSDSSVQDLKPGAVIDSHMNIKCKDGVLVPLVVQMEGKNPCNIDDFILGYNVLNCSIA